MQLTLVKIFWSLKSLLPVVLFVVTFVYICVVPSKNLTTYGTQFSKQLTALGTCESFSIVDIQKRFMTMMVDTKIMVPFIKKKVKTDLFSLWAFSVSVSRKFTWIHWITLCWQPTKMYQMSWLWQFSYYKCTRFIVRCMTSQYTKTLAAKRFNHKAAKWGDDRKPQIHLSEEFEDRDFMGFGWVVDWGVGIIYCWKSTGWNHRVRRWRNWFVPLWGYLVGISYSAET